MLTVVLFTVTAKYFMSQGCSPSRYNSSWLAWGIHASV